MTYTYDGCGERNLPLGIQGVTKLQTTTTAAEATTTMIGVDTEYLLHRV